MAKNLRPYAPGRGKNTDFWLSRLFFKVQFHVINLATLHWFCYIVTGNAQKARSIETDEVEINEEDNNMAKINQQMILQFNGREFDLGAVEANVKKNWKESGKKLSDIVDLDIYVKPEEAAVYYVVNKETEGKVEL